MNRRRFINFAVLVLLAAGLSPAAASDSVYERPPINYPSVVPQDPVAKLASKIASGKVRPKYDEKFGYLPWLLEALHVPVSSQTLVFSKTSFQRDLISPSRPRALYYNDEVYIGYVAGGPVLEITATDPQNGPMFYVLSQKKTAGAITFPRQLDECLQCHASSITSDLPGHIVRSVFADPDGQPILSAGSFRVNQTTPLRQRWGGWYVTGASGTQLHMGNVTTADREHAREADFSAGLNLKNLSGRFDTSKYLSPHSDIAALMVLEHQTFIHNLITRANYQTRLALYDCAELNKALGREPNHRTEGTISRIKNAAEPLLRAMLMCEEATLEAPLQGTSSFAGDFAKQGPRDAKGRSLRDLDLSRRLLKHPLSYLIYSSSFDALPHECREQFYKRLHEVLSGADTSKEFDHLSPEDRRGILEILVATKQNLPAYFR